MKIDMHIHTRYSLDGRGEPKEFVKAAKKKGLSGIAVTDHNEIHGALKAREYAEDMDGFLVIVGEEISTREGHILAYNIRKAVERDLTPEATIEKIHEQGGFAVAAHPGRFPSGLKRNIIKGLGFDGVESLNGATIPCKNRKAKKLAEKMKVGVVGGSDSHFPDKVGAAYTVFEGSSLGAMDVQQHVLQRRSEAGGSSLAYHSEAALALKIFIRWVARGGKNI